MIEKSKLLPAMLNKGDTIPCKSKEEMLEAFKFYESQGIHVDFNYDNGLWLIVTGKE